MPRVSERDLLDALRVGYARSHARYIGQSWHTGYLDALTELGERLGIHEEDWKLEVPQEEQDASVSG